MAIHASSVIKVARGRTIIQEGEGGQGFYVLQKGSLEVSKNGVVLALLMYPGTVFGEMGDILGKERSCTIRAKTDAEIFHVAAEDMEQTIRENPDIAIKIIKTLASRLERTTQKFVDQAEENTIWTVRS